MRISKRTRTRGGFTLTELMITVALIGVLSAIAIPNFLSYQARARRSEAYTNVAGIARAYKAYHAESGRFPDILTVTAATTGAEATLPDWTEHGLPQLGTRKIPWDAETETFFGIVGWGAEGNVFYSYDVNSEGDGCTCTSAQCFTATAHGNVDGDLDYSAVMYVHPLVDAAGTATGWCTDSVEGYQPPIRPATGDEIFDEVAIRQGEPY